MPLLWKYLIFDYLKVLLLSTLVCVALLLTLRFDEIAHFACLGSSWLELFQFIALQLPYLLPIALPFSALISAYLLFSKLSFRNELTALRSSGLPLRTIIAPILITASFLSLGDFYLTSELASTAHLLNGQVRHKLRTINPLLLLQNKRILAMQGVFCETLGALRHGEFASDVLFAIPDRSNNRISLLLAKTIRGAKNSIEVEQMSLLQSFPVDQDFDKLVIENIAYLDTPFEAFTPALQQKTWTVHPDHLRLELLHYHIEKLKALISQSVNSLEINTYKKQLDQSYSELVRRFSISLALFTFTLLGITFGIHNSRSILKGKITLLSIAAGGTLLCYFLAKSLDDKIIPSSLLYTLPQILLILFSSFKLNQLSKGRE